MSSEWVSLTGVDGRMVHFRTMAISVLEPVPPDEISYKTIVYAVDGEARVKETPEEVLALLGIKHETDQDLILRILRRHGGSAADLMFGSLGPGVGFRFDEDGRLLGVEHAPR